MDIGDLQSICKKFKGVTEDIKWEHHLCFNVGSKMFLMTSPDQVPCSAVFKVSDEEFDEIIQQPGFSASAYIGRYKWISLDDISRLSKQEWEHYLRQSYELVASRLPKKLRKKLELE